MFQNVWIKSTQVGQYKMGVGREDERKRLQNGHEVIEDEDEKSRKVYP